jgi:DNA polymerase-1
MTKMSNRSKLMKKLILIDGNAILHRAYHALPPLTNKKGEVVNAVYGFCSMFLKIIQDLKPEYVSVCFDREAPTFRKELYVGYQAKRPKTADDLIPQIGIVHNVLQKMGVAIFEVDGYEADDLIGTLARQALEDTKILRHKDIKKKEKKSPNILISQYLISLQCKATSGMC